MDNPEKQVPGEPLLDEAGNPVLDEHDEPVRWATKKQRRAALIAAIAVILITAAYIWSIYTGTLFTH